MKNFLEKHVKQYDIGIAVVMLLTYVCGRPCADRSDVAEAGRNKCENKNYQD